MSKARNLFLFTTGALIFVLLLTGLALLAKDQEDEHRWLGRERRHRAAHIGGDDEGNEAAGQIAVWLMVAANLPVAVSILIRWTAKSIPVGNGLKRALAGLNRFQRRHLMRLHYLVNPLVLVVALWHWLTSRCRTTALPEWGLALMAVLIVLGLTLKFRLVPKGLRSSVYRLHTHPLAIVALVMLLSLGHLMVD